MNDAELDALASKAEPHPHSEWRWYCAVSPERIGREAIPAEIFALLYNRGDKTQWVCRYDNPEMAMHYLRVAVEQHKQSQRKA